MTNHPWTWRPFILWAKKGEVMASIRVDANFPGGAVENVEINNLTIVFEAPLDNSPQSLWYFFRVIGAQGQRLTLIQKGWIMFSACMNHGVWPSSTCLEGWGRRPMATCRREYYSIYTESFDFSF